MANFALIGAAGFVAPRHMKAIHETGGRLVAALDPHDSVGVLDQYFPDCRYFTEFERFDRFLSRAVQNGDQIDYVVVASPNYLHDAHCRFGLRVGADVICEKPLVLYERNIDELLRLEEETGKRIWNILQLRLSLAAQVIKRGLTNGFHTAAIQYNTPRGKWYDYSWKGDVQKSGGLCTNIGIHLFDLLQWFFGPVAEIGECLKNGRSVSGFLYFKNAQASFALSIAQENTPQRVFTVDGESIDMTPGFTDLHTESYRKILDGRGFGIEHARPAVRLCEMLRKEVQS